MEYMLTVHFTSEDNDFAGNTPDAVAEIVERMLPYMVDNVDVSLIKKGRLMYFQDFDAFMRHMLDAFPEAQVDQDNDGQLVIYTGLTATGDDTAPVVKMEN